MSCVRARQNATYIIMHIKKLKKKKRIDPLSFLLLSPYKICASVCVPCSFSLVFFSFLALRLTLCVTLYGIVECINAGKKKFEMRENPTDFGHIYTIFYLACPCACYFPLSLSLSIASLCFLCEIFVVP